jgi:hypothetical protein
LECEIIDLNSALETFRFVVVFFVIGVSNISVRVFNFSVLFVVPVLISIASSNWWDRPWVAPDVDTRHWPKLLSVTLVGLLLLKGLPFGVELWSRFNVTPCLFVGLFNLVELAVTLTDTQ